MVASTNSKQTLHHANNGGAAIAAGETATTTAERGAAVHINHLSLRPSPTPSNLLALSASPHSVSNTSTFTPSTSSTFVSMMPQLSSLSSPTTTPTTTPAAAAAARAATTGTPTTVSSSLPSARLVGVDEQFAMAVAAATATRTPLSPLNSNQPIVRLNVRTVTGQVFIVMLPLSATVLRVKRTVECEKTIPVAFQRLIFGGREMMDESVLSTLGVEDGVTLHLFLRMQPPPAPHPSQEPIVPNMTPIQHAGDPRLDITSGGIPIPVGYNSQRDAANNLPINGINPQAVHINMVAINNNNNMGASSSGGMMMPAGSRAMAVDPASGAVMVAIQQSNLIRMIDSYRMSTMVRIIAVVDIVTIVILALFFSWFLILACALTVCGYIGAYHFKSRYVLMHLLWMAASIILRILWAALNYTIWGALVLLVISSFLQLYMFALTRRFYSLITHLAEPERVEMMRWRAAGRIPPQIEALVDD